MYNRQFYSLSTLLVASFTIASLLISVDALAEYRVATVNINKVLNNSKEAQVKKKELDKLSKKAKEQIDKRREELEKMEARLKDSKASEDSDAVERFRDQAKDFQRFVKDQEEDLKMNFLKTNKELTEKTLELVREYARNKGFDLVLDKGASVGGTVIFTADDNDITEEIIAKINK